MSHTVTTEPTLLLQDIPIGPDQRFRLGKATLNQPKTLNALSLDMIQALQNQLDAWAQDPTIAVIWLEGAGERSFCAGGDVVEVYRSLATDKDDHPGEALAYFSAEYRLDYTLHTIPKPVLCWGHGIVMGGGMGLLQGADFRVITESTQLAMPEITLSLFPDVGGSWFLNRMPGQTGRFIALTGARLNPADALFAGLADRCLRGDSKRDVLNVVRETQWSGDTETDRQTLYTILREQAHHDQRELRLPESPLRRQYDRIHQLLDHPDIESVVHAITGLTDQDPWLQQAANSLAKGSPVAAWVIDRQLRRTRYSSLAEVFRHELALAVNCCRLGEFREGVRALLIDKDHQPRWRYPDMASVEAGFVDAHFEPLPVANPLEDLE